MLKTKVTCAATALSLAAACGSGGNGGGNNAPEPPIADIQVSGVAFDGDVDTTLGLISTIGVVPGTGGFGDGKTASEAAGFRYAYGQTQQFGTGPNGTLEPIAIDQLDGRAGFAIDTRALSGDVPDSGSASYNGVFEFDHVTGIGEAEDGTFSTGTATKTGGEIFYTVQFDDGTFSGQGTNGTAEVVLTMEGQVSGAGEMTGTVVAAGMDADLEGLIFGDPNQSSASAGAFAGTTETELLIGGFAAETPDP
ncbi:MAG: hypothetical protein AAFP85_10590 [Pseudomonadota bacterium]